MNDDEKQWERVYTGADFTTSLLKAEIEDLGIETKVRSNQEAGLHSGFGPSGFALLYVKEEDTSKVAELIQQFEEKMK